MAAEEGGFVTDGAKLTAKETRKYNIARQESPRLECILSLIDDDDGTAAASAPAADADDDDTPRIKVDMLNYK